MANKPQPGVLERALRDGTLARLAPHCRSQNELAARLGLSKDAFISQKVRLIAKGVVVPSFEELRAANQNVVAQDSTAPDGFLDRMSVEWMQQQSANENRWPNLAAFDSQPYIAPHNPACKKLTRAECPDGTTMLWASDIHIPIHNVEACNLMMECAERIGVSRIILGGDILDMNCLSRHAKESHRVVAHATILEEVEPGRDFLNWCATKQTDYILGNHEDRLRRFIDENPAFHGSLVQDFAKVCNLPPNLNVLDGEVRLGNLSMFHGHKEFKNSTGGQYPAHKILNMFPDQSSIFGHLHRKATAYRTTHDEDGINRTRRAWAMGHLSLEHEHYGYMSRSPNWQTGFGVINVYWEGERPRFTVYQVEVLFDRYNRPHFEFMGRVYGRRAA